MEIYRFKLNIFLKKSDKPLKENIKLRFWDRESIITSNLRKTRKIKIRVGNG